MNVPQKTVDSRLVVLSEDSVYTRELQAFAITQTPAVQAELIRITAIAMEPSEESIKLCKNLSCALKEQNTSGLVDKNTYKQIGVLITQEV